MVRKQVNLYLDDVRKPHGDGWTVVQTVEEAKKILMDPTLRVVIWTLDHDLGACEKCLEGKSAEQWLEEHNYQSMPNCPHFGTGYDLLCWLEENPQYWPTKEPALHTANPVGRQRMAQIIKKRYYR